LPVHFRFRMRSHTIPQGDPSSGFW
jgi:hypothetical protein